MSQKRGLKLANDAKSVPETTPSASVGIEFDADNLQLLHFLLESKHAACPGCTRIITLQNMQIIVEQGTNHVYVLDMCMVCHELTGIANPLVRIGR